ncbi:hypothetical protein QBZ16_003879 [Prototheca wickerhamii]|uniref:Uncharacterized protein n=1 Tax=Prototheca wickerhamii TaxID=3111 RepID=A0AAD9IHY2_PROWI|nr:hypothetical protein QBZ16_003879 [Prototheca wickerhamii]
MSTGVSEVITALQAAQAVGATKAQRASASALFEQVGSRWDEYSESEQQHWVALSFAQLQQISSNGQSWALRSKAALLLALVIRRAGAAAWEAGLDQLLSLAQGGPAFQGLAALVFKYVAEEVTQAAPDDIGAEAKRLLVNALTRTTPSVLGFLEMVLESGFRSLTDAAGSPAAREAEAAMHDALAAAATMAEWVPQSALVSCGLLTACSFFLSHASFRDEAVRVLRQLAGRKPEQEPEADVARAQEALAGVLGGGAAALLAVPDAASRLGWEGDDVEFAQALCEAAAAQAGTHWPRLTQSGDAEAAARRDALLSAMLGLARQPFAPLSDQAFAFWTAVLGDAAAAAAPRKAEEGGAPAGAYERLLPRAAVEAIAGVAAERLSPAGGFAAHVPLEGADEVPPWFDSFGEYKDFSVAHRQRLTLALRHAAAVIPAAALRVAAGGHERRVRARRRAGRGGRRRRRRGRARRRVPGHGGRDRAARVGGPGAERGPAAGRGDAGALGALLDLAPGEPELVALQTRGLEAFAPVVAACPDVAAPGLARVLDLLVSALPGAARRGPARGRRCGDGEQLARWREALTARQQLAGVPLSWAKAAPEAVLPCLEALAARVRAEWDAGRLRLGERNAVAEAMLLAVTGARAPPAVQASVLDWAIGPVRAAWAQPAFLEALASPAAFWRAYMPVGPAGVGGGPRRWALYHEVHLIERAVRRLAQADGASEVTEPSQRDTRASTALTEQMRWALPCLLRALACVQACWTPEGRAALGSAAGALEMAPAERALYLRRGPHRKKAVFYADLDDSVRQQEDPAVSGVGGSTTGALRGFLRHVREYAWQAVGALPGALGPALGALPEAAALVGPALACAVDVAEMHSVRIMLRHALAPLVRGTPPAELDAWVLAPLAPDAALADDVVRDRVLRELSQEYASLLAAISQRSVAPRAPAARRRPPSPLLEYILRRDEGTAFALISVAVLGLTWPDESAYRCSVLCRALTPLVLRPGAGEALAAYVGGEVLPAAIRSLGSPVLVTHQADILGLIREILLAPPTAPYARAVLASLPGGEPGAGAAADTEAEHLQGEAFRALFG